MRQKLKESAEENAKQMKSAAETFQSIIDKHNETMARYHNSLLELELLDANLQNQNNINSLLTGMREYENSE